MKIKKKEQSVGILGKITSLFSNSKTDAYSCDYVNNAYKWKQATDNGDNTFTLPITWDALKEISIRTLGTDSETFAYLTVPKEQWLNDGTYPLINIVVAGSTGGSLGYANYTVTQKNSDNFVITKDGTAGSSSIYYK